MKSSSAVLALTNPSGPIVMFCYTTINAEPVGYLESFNPEAFAGRGSAEFTHDKRRALRFLNFTDGLECWRLQSIVNPLRPDGKPNRPLTAFHANFPSYEAGEPPLDNFTRGILNAIIGSQR